MNQWIHKQPTPILQEDIKTLRGMIKREIDMDKRRNLVVQYQQIKLILDQRAADPWNPINDPQGGNIK